LKKQAEAARRMLDNPFGVNLNTPAPVYPDRLNQI
jgi:hypothetical protein